MIILLILHFDTVAPFVGAWIEILKYTFQVACIFVAPFVGAWIEMLGFVKRIPLPDVAPFVGAWIEIYDIYDCFYDDGSLRSSERGLK